MLAGIFGKNYQRQRLFKKTQSEVMKAYLADPFPSKNELITNVGIVSIDFEATGLDVKRDSIVSVGMVDIVNMGINLASCSHQIITPNNELTENSVIIHGITDSHCINAKSIADALPDLLMRLKGKVMLAHNAQIELGFLNRVCKSLYGTEFIIPVIDTMYLAKRSFERANRVYKSNDLRLFNLRKKYNMPEYKAHNAQNDAIATAELFLAIAVELAPKNNMPLRDFLM